MPTTNKPLQEFQKMYNRANCISSQDELRYCFNNYRHISKAVSEAELIIEKHNMDLIAEHKEGEPFFTVRSNVVAYGW